MGSEMCIRDSAKPPPIGEPRVPLTFEKDLVAGDGPILGKGAYGVTRLSKSSFTGEYYAVRASFSRTAITFGRRGGRRSNHLYLDWVFYHSLNCQLSAS